MRRPAIPKQRRRGGFTPPPSSHPLSGAVNTVGTVGGNLNAPLLEWAGNLPAGMTLYGDTLFGDILNGEVLNAAGYTVAGTQAGISSGQLRTDVNKTDGSAPNTADVYEYSYPEGSLGAGVGVDGGLFFGTQSASWKRMYVCFDLWLSANYVTHTNQEKLWYPYGNTSNTSLNMAIPSGGTSEGIAAMAIQPQTDRGVQNVTSPTGFIAKGEWQQIEVYMQQNTPSSTDGVLRVWRNGTLVWEITSDLNYGNANSDPVFIGPRIASTRGGGDSTVPVPSGGMTRRFSRLACHYSTTL